MKYDCALTDGGLKTRSTLISRVNCEVDVACLDHTNPFPLCVAGDCLYRAEVARGISTHTRLAHLPQPSDSEPTSAKI